MYSLTIIKAQKGQAVIAVAVAFSFFAMLIGLAVDGGRAYLTRARLAKIVDSAAINGARHWSSSDQGQVIAAACDAARLNNMTVEGPPGTCPPEIHAGVEDITIQDGSTRTGVVVRAAATLPTSFLRLGTLLGCGDACRQANISVRAAAIALGPHCVFALNPTESDGLEVLGTANLDVEGCGVYVGSSDPEGIHTTGDAAITAGFVEVVGGASDPSAITPPPIMGAPSRTDPLAHVAEPEAPGGACTPQPSGDDIYFTPGYYCKVNLTHGTAVFAPGEYYIENGFQIIGEASASGNGVFFFVANGAVKIAGTGSVDFSAPTSGTYAGLTFFQARSNTTGAVITGDQSFHVEGLYFPSASLDLGGGSCTKPLTGLIVADTIRIVGSTCIDKPSVLPTDVSYLAYLVN